MSDIRFGIIAKGAVLPPQEPVKSDAREIEAVIVRVDPENGYDHEGTDEQTPRPSEHALALVSYPGDIQKRHQFKTAKDLLTKISDFLQRRIGFTDFQFETVPDVIKPGTTIKAFRETE